MKTIINLKFCGFLAISLFLGSCGGNTEKSGPEYTSAYICPMHCEGSGSDKEGKCPVCKMDYVKNEQHLH